MINALSADSPPLITDARPGHEQDLATRKRRYTIMMGARLPLMVLATVFDTIPWLAVALLIISLPLPWMAVLIANDRLPNKRENVNRYEATASRSNSPALSGQSAAMLPGSRSHFVAIACATRQRARRPA